jgi:DNA-binding NarL/FixJ family response regulator
MTPPPHTCLILARAGHRRAGLHALLSTFPQLELVGETDDCTVALELLAQRGPDLLLIDTDVTADVTWQVLRQIKASSPQTRRLLFVDSARQKLAAEAPAAEAVLLYGDMPQELTATIERLLVTR